MPDVMICRPAGLASLPDCYGPLFDRAVSVFAADDRVRGMWLHGAVARDAADAGSDLDITLAVADAGFDDFAAGWETWLAAIAPTLTARPLGPGSCYALTTTCERFDVMAEPVSKLPETILTRRVAVFDKDGLGTMIPPPSDPPPDRHTIAFLIEETLRQAANFPTVIVRADWLMGVVAVQQIQLFLYELFAESNKPMPPTGPKQWSFKLTARQRSVLQSLPVAAPAEQSVRTARDAALAAFLREAPPIAQRTSVPWPDDLHQAVRAFLDTEGVPLPW